MPKIGNENADAFATYRDCLSESLLRVFDRAEKVKPRNRRSRGRKNSRVTEEQVECSRHENAREDHGPEELGDFIEYLAREIFDAFPVELQTLSYPNIQRDARLVERYSLPLSLDVLENIVSSFPATVLDTLTTYSLLPSSRSLNSFLTPSIHSYVSAVTSPPPPYLPFSKASECEICGRDWIPLTYHHLIPQSTHEKCLKRGWHEEWELEAVAWLCRACHSFVHKIASNEELAREWFTVDRLVQREDVKDWAKWVGRVRWRKT